MKAVMNTRYGSPDGLEIQEVQRPEPTTDEVLVKIHASSVTRADSMMRQGIPHFGRLFLGLTKPKHPMTGTGFAGEVIEVGQDVSQYVVGDKVFGESVFGSGTNTEYICLSETGMMAKLPEGMPYDAGASVCDGAVTSLNFLKNLACIQEGQQVLIYGASGSLGSAAVQIAKHYGAVVTGVCSANNMEMVKGLGADKIIDYQHEDFTAQGKTYDIIYDTVGKLSFSQCQKSLTEKGRYLSPILSIPLFLKMLQTSICGSKKAKFSATGMLHESELKEMLVEVRDMLQAGHLKTVIDRRYPLAKVAEAHRYVDTGHKRGNVIISSALSL
ncbi:MAG: NAD(P)-dependent alcohol dehydrogenase [Ghiorsea sp.]|nr:NAD(P)-dependent alcohol dehydrogenase [Ghiorsea sp.]